MTSLERALGFAGANAATAIQLGGLWIESRKIEEALHRYVKHLFALNSNQEIPYSFPGSASAIRLDNRQFLFCCGHQFKRHWNPDQIAFCIYKTNTIISATSMFEPIVDQDNKDSDYIDARAFRFGVEKYDHSNLESEFFPITASRIWPQDTHNLPFLVYGYPSCLQDVDYSSPKIASKAIEISGRYDGGTNSPHMHRIRLSGKRHFDADGMSGGPVFYIGRAQQGYFVGWAGMIVRGAGAGCEFIHFLSAHFLMEMVLHRPVAESIRL